MEDHQYYLSFVLYKVWQGRSYIRHYTHRRHSLARHLSGRTMMFPALPMRLSGATTTFRTQSVLNEVVEDACIGGCVRVLEVKTVAGARNCDLR
jgi:hypothetical protein